LQDTNEALKIEVHRLARADDENTTKLKLQVFLLTSPGDIVSSFYKNKKCQFQSKPIFFFFLI
jgi:hypothetical protein